MLKKNDNGIKAQANKPDEVKRVESKRIQYFHNKLLLL